MVFLDDNLDTFYKVRRDASILIGLHCKEGDDYCFCNSIELQDFFDLMFYDKGKEYAVETGSKKGVDFIKKYKKFFKEAGNIITDKDRKIVNKKKLNTTDIKDMYNNEDWKKGSDICVSCGACNFLCPNCHCFNVEDEVNFDLKSGKRVRKPASCQLRHFTRVAGEHVFRDDRVARFKHRIYHQIQYFKDRHDVVFCTGCGRCIEGCPAKIDWVEIINEMR
jgi:ferredoxin